MTYSVYQHWDPLKVCIVGRSYSPEFYSFIKNSRVKSVLEKIASETEEDYQKLIKLLESFGVDVLRPTVYDDYTRYLVDGKIEPPPMTPRDYSIMLGEKFFFQTFDSPDAIDIIPEINPVNYLSDISRFTWDKILQTVNHNNPTYIRTGQYLKNFGSAMTTRVGKDVYIGTSTYTEPTHDRLEYMKNNFPEYRWHIVNTGGHSDGTFCPVVPGLIISLCDVPTYKETFPDWEVVYLPGQSWNKMPSFYTVKQKNYGKWWVPGEELNDEFTEFVESWLNHWVGYVEETVFDVNMLVIDQKNVICSNYNKTVFDALKRHGVTPHIINFRHRYFWDGGLHCITSDIHREGTKQNYFPERD